MFKNKDASFEIADAMENHLVGQTMEKRAENISKFAKAMDYLNAVAEIFDELGLSTEAEATTILLEKVAAGKKSKKKSKSKKPSKSSKKTSPTKGLTPEKMVSNLAHKGWVFNVDDENPVNDHSKGCMCSMCMDVNDVKHGDDCVCHLCMDTDDNNHHFDSDKDSSYHIEHDDNYADFLDVLDDNDMNDFEDEMDAADEKKHNRHESHTRLRTIIPPRHRDTLIPSIPPPSSRRNTQGWNYIEHPEDTPFMDEGHFGFGDIDANLGHTRADEDDATIPPFHPAQNNSRRSKF